MTAAEALSTLLPGEALAPGLQGGPPTGRRPEAVVRPATAEEVVTLLAWAGREGVGVLPMASGARAGPVTREGRYVALSTERLAGIYEYEAANLTLTAGAGTPFSTVDAAFGEHGQWAPFDPPHVSRRSVGGLVADGAAGPLRMGYGDLRNHVLGLTVVTGDGRTLRLGGRVVKNVAGYDLLKSVIGSRGSLAVITSVVLRAFPRPVVDRVLVRSGRSMEELVGIALGVGTAPVLPVSSVIVDRFGEDPARPALIVRLHGARETVDADQKRLEGHVGLAFDEPTTVDLEAVRDHAAGGSYSVVASSLPSRLGRVLDALSRLEPEAVLVDSYGGLVRLAVSEGGLAALTEARRAVEALGGALSVRPGAAVTERSAGVLTGRPGSEPAGGDPDTATAPVEATKLPAEATSCPTEAEQALIQGLREAFDPLEVLWPARR